MSSNKPVIKLFGIFFCAIVTVLGLNGCGAGGDAPPTASPAPPLPPLPPPPAPVPSGAITAFADAGGGNVVVTSVNTLVPGSTIVISGTTNYNNTFVVVSVTSSSFVITATFAGNDATGVWTGVGGEIPGCTTQTVQGSSAAITLPSPVTVMAGRISGVAPLGVFFDASATTSTSTTRPFHELEYRWSFGDAGSGTWGDKTTGSSGNGFNTSRNAAVGPLAAHVYETPGLYTVAVTVTDGTNIVSNACLQILALDPNVTFAGANTACFSTSGNFTGCPGDVPLGNKITTSDFGVVTGTATSGNTIRRLLMRRGETWTATTQARLNVNGPGILGAFGAGVAPIVQTSGPNLTSGITTILNISSGSTPNIGDWRVMDLEFNGRSDGSVVSGANGVIGGGGANQLTFLRMHIRDIHNGIQFFGPALVAPHQIWDQLFIVDSTVQRLRGGNGGNGLYLSAQRAALLGNLGQDSGAGFAQGAEHITRFQWLNKGVIQANNFGQPNNSKVALTIRAINQTTPFVGSSRDSEQVVITGNLIRGEQSSGGIVFTPDSSAEDERLRNFILDGNFVKAGVSSPVLLGLRSAVDDVTVRNNIFDMTGGAGATCMRFGREGVEPAHTRIRVYNNTCYTDYPIASQFGMIVVFLDATNSDVHIHNNLGYAPGHPTQAILLSNAGSTGVTGASGTFGNSSNAQIRATSPLFVNAGGASASDFQVTPGSYAINIIGGVAVPVHSDFFRTNRPIGSFDAGMAEQ